jgi:hypothetical protein
MIMTAIFAAASIGTGSAQVMDRRASIRRGGNPNEGKCTIEVVVDGTAEVEVRGDVATLHNLAGQLPQWRRFECTGPLPPNPANFRFAGVDGRGRQDLVRDPRNGGAAVVRIDDPKGGTEGYTFDLFWSNAGGYRQGGGEYERGGYPQAGGYPPREGRRIPVDRAVQVCQDAVRQQASQQFRTPNVIFRDTRIDDNPGRRDWVVGTVEARRYNREEHFRFSCSVDFETGTVRSARIDPIEGGGRGPGGYGNSAAGTGRAMESCQRAVEDRIRQDGFGRVQFGSMNVENRPGNNDWIVGNARAEGRNRSESYDFSCQVELRDGDVRSVDVRRR